jgi:tetratricopeptide (TPR) repeat protein
MLCDFWDQPLTTASLVARDAYVEGCERLVTMYPGAVAAFERAIAADPDFVLAHVGKARRLQARGDAGAARAALSEAEAVAGGLSARETSHLRFFGHLIRGEGEAALAALCAHLAEWPRDGVVLSTSISPGGLIGMSGRPGLKQAQLALMDGLARHYEDDWFFLGHHAFALAETGQCAAARPMLERSLARNPRNAMAAHTAAHIAYEDADLAGARTFLAGWLPGYPRDGHYHAHLWWHLALAELEAGEPGAAMRIYREQIAPEVNHGQPFFVLVDTTSFLWRIELAGHAAGVAAWRAVHAVAHRASPAAGNAFADWHVALADAATGDDAGMAARLSAMEAMLAAGRYPAGAVVPAVARAFAAMRAGDYAGAAATLAPVLPERDRLGGSLAQTDLVEFTLLRAYLGAGRAEEAQRLLAARRAGAGGLVVEGAEALCR